ncbi:hypothetical protein [Halovenus marina]|uniref:hypothetical protein n=1 Tax=Halovenus marina TaxID=3396621 RepID=UPI003F57D2B5
MVVLAVVVEVVTVSRDTKARVQELLDEIGADVDLQDSSVSLEEQPVTHSESAKDFVDVSSTEISVIKEFEPGEDTAGDITNEYLLEDGSRVSVTVKKRPRCPSCSYIPTEDGEPVHLTGTCTECGTKVCPSCRNECEACGTILCSSCTMGHGVKDETYCPICRQDVQEEVEHSRELESREQMHRERMDMVEAGLEERKQRAELEEKEKQASHERELDRVDKKLEVRRQEHEEKMDKLETELEKWKKEREFEQKRVNDEHSRLMDEFEAELQEWKAKSEHSRQLDKDKHSEEMDRIDKMIALARMINESDSTESIRDRLTPGDNSFNQFEDYGGNFKELDFDDSSK